MLGARFIGNTICYELLREPLLFLEIRSGLGAVPQCVSEQQQPPRFGTSLAPIRVTSLVSSATVLSVRLFGGGCATPGPHLVNELCNLYRGPMGLFQSIINESLALLHSGGNIFHHFLHALRRRAAASVHQHLPRLAQLRRQVGQRGSDRRCFRLHGIRRVWMREQLVSVQFLVHHGSK